MATKIKVGDEIVFRLKGEMNGIVGDIRPRRLPNGNHRTDYIVIQPEQEANFKFHRFCYYDRQLKRMAINVQEYQINVVTMS